MACGALCLVGLVGLVGMLGACGSFSATETPSDAGIEPLDSAVPPPQDASPAADASTAFCADHAGALFCDDFEADDLATRWPLRELDLGLVDVIDGVNVGRPGKVVRFVRTKPGGTDDIYLRLRRQLGATLPVRIAYDLRMNDWPTEAGLSNITGGNFIHGALNSWLAVTGESKSLSFLAYTNHAFYRQSGQMLGLTAPVDRWEHYEVVVIPGDPAHFELWIGTPPVKVVDDTVKVTLPEGGTLSPTFVEIGFSRSNAGPMPAIEVYYDNVVVTSAP